MSSLDRFFRSPGLRSFLVWPRAALTGRRERRRANGSALSALHGSTVLVTGASSGIGRATAELLGRNRVRVLALARSADALEELVDSIVASGGEALALTCDLAETTQVATVLEQLAETPISAVVSNAGLSVHRSVLLTTQRRDLERSVAVNLSGPAQLLLGIVPRMIAAGGGTVVNVSTVSAKPPPAPQWGNYQSTKTAFDVWLRSAAIEWRNDGIKVRTVYMPLVATPMTASGGLYPTAPALTADEAARIVTGALCRGRNRVAPWWLVWQDLTATALPAVFDRIFQWQARR